MSEGITHLAVIILRCSVNRWTASRLRSNFGECVNILLNLPAKLNNLMG